MFIFVILMVCQYWLLSLVGLIEVGLLRWLLESVSADVCVSDACRLIYRALTVGQSHSMSKIVFLLWVAQLQ